jgi:hypothetical protein
MTSGDSSRASSTSWTVPFSLTWAKCSDPFVSTQGTGRYLGIVSERLRHSFKLAVALLLRIRVFNLSRSPSGHVTRLAMSTSFKQPVKALLTPAQLDAFQSSNTRNDILKYIETLNDAVVAVKLSDKDPQPSEVL